MRFKKVYIEITNICNYACSFCTTTDRKLGFMLVADFERIVEQIKPYTKYIYLHVLGEPLLHPHIETFLQIAQKHGLFVNISTNGSLLYKKLDLLMHHDVRQINVSLHDAFENVQPPQWATYFDEIIAASKVLAPNTYMNLRLWNIGVDTQNSFNNQCIEALAHAFGLDSNALAYQPGMSSLPLTEHIFLQYALRFSWPTVGQLKPADTPINCYALRDHVAVLCNGDVVPCCIDANGALKLGNLFEESFGQIIQKPRAVAIRKGFENHRAVEPFCLSCGFHQ